MFDSLDISASGLVAQRVRMDTISSNIANQYTTGNAAGKADPYKRKFTIFTSAANGAGVQVRSIDADNSPGPLKYDPGHEHAIKSGPEAGYVRMPNVDLNIEMTNAIEATRAYEANISALQVTKQMYAADLRILA